MNPEKPTVQELARIAAALANGKPIDSDRATGLAREAMLVWQACACELRTPNLTEQCVRKAAEKRGSCPAVTCFPIPHDKFLIMAFGGDDVPNRIKQWRDFLRYVVQRNRAVEQGCMIDLVPLPEVHDVNVQETLKTYQQNGISEGNYANLYTDIQEWRASRRRQQAKNAVNERWNRQRASRSKSKKRGTY